MKRSGELKRRKGFARGGPLARTRMRRTVSDTDPTPETTATVWCRDDGRCAKCGGPVHGARGFDWSLSHRRPRRAGGDPRPETNLPANLVLLHGSGTTGCHGEVESRRAEAITSGQLLHAGDIPAAVAIEHAVHGWCYLTDDGRVATVPPEVAA